MHSVKFNFCLHPFVPLKLDAFLNSKMCFFEITLLSFGSIFKDVNTSIHMSFITHDWYVCRREGKGICFFYSLTSKRK